MNQAPKLSWLSPFLVCFEFSPWVCVRPSAARSSLRRSQSFRCSILLSQPIPKQLHSFSCHFTCLLLLSLLLFSISFPSLVLLHLCPLLFFMLHLFFLFFVFVSLLHFPLFSNKNFLPFFHFSCFHHAFIIFHFYCFLFPHFHLFHLIVYFRHVQRGPSKHGTHSQRITYLSGLRLLVPPPVWIDPLARTLWHLDLRRGRGVCYCGYDGRYVVR